MDPWYKVATPRKEVREGRSFNPDEFAIAIEQVVAGTAPEDYRDPFESGVFLLRKAAAEMLKAGVTPEPAAETKTIRLIGTIPPALWNRLGTKILPKLRAGANLKVGLEFSVTVKADGASSLESEFARYCKSSD